MVHARILPTVAVVTCLILLAGCEEAPPPIVEELRAIKTVTVTEIAAGQIRKIAGIVQAKDSSTLSFEVDGNVREVKVKLGNTVKKGQVLATLDKQPYQLDVQAAEAEFSKARAAMSQASGEFERQEQLFSRGWIAEARLDRVRRQRDSAKSQVDYSISKLKLAKRDLNKTVMHAPFAGVIAKKEVDPFVEVRAGQMLFELEAAGALEIAFDAPETLIAQITLEMPVGISFPTEADCRCTGRITEIGATAGTANAFPIKASLIDPPKNVRSGMTAEVTMTLIGGDDSKRGAFLVPLSAIVPGENPRKGYVFIYKPETETVHRSSIASRGVTGNMVQIDTGVKAGDVVAVAGVTFLSDGQKVTLLSK